MTKAFICDQCEAFVGAVPFEVYHAVDAIDDDGETFQDVDVLHFCSDGCLANYAMALTLDYPEEPETTTT